MARVLDIVELGEPLLRQIAAPVADPTDAAIAELIEDLLCTVAAAGGMGIAATQVGRPSRVVILCCQPNERYPYAPSMQPTAMINPEILWQSEQTEKDWEGCLSVPGIRALVPRSTSIKVRYQLQDGQTVTADYAGFLARVYQHEVDHLDGRVFLDRVDNAGDIATEKAWHMLIARRTRDA